MTTPSSTGPLIAPRWMPFAEPISLLYTTNPFEPLWEERQQAALGDRYRPGDDAGNRARITAQLAPIVAVTAQQLADGVTATAEELALYQGLVLYTLWDDYGPRFQRLIDKKEVEVPFWDEFAERHHGYLRYPGLSAPEPGHLLSLLYEAYRTWHFVRSLILGSSPLAAATRASLFRASMTGNLCIYADGLYSRMHEIPVLITGETGTGKDLAARCVGWSRYIPFDAEKRRFATTYDGDFHARSICEMAGSVLESELFGHKRGSFTGATADKIGCLALPQRYGTLFLDEIGELPLDVQAKLLRPFENREIVPVGETRPRPIPGQLVFATNQDLEAMCLAGTFRRDLYERMKAVRIHMPPLHAMLAQAPGDLRIYVRASVAAKIDSPARVEALTDRVVASIHAGHPDPGWSGNLRALKHYTEYYIVTDGHVSGPAAPAAASPPAAPIPAAAASPPPPADPRTPESTCLPSSGILGPKAKAGEVSFVEATRALVTWTHVLTGQNTAETARLMEVDRRTVTRWLDPARLARWLKRSK
jgi:DNA-binding NtrC family response regulator